MWQAALIWAAVPSVLAGAHPGACGLVQSVGPASVVVAIIAYYASEMMRPKCPSVPPPKWVSIAREFAWRNFLVAWSVW
jgi:hypothetical protein